MTRAHLVTAALSTLCACSPMGALLPDGGRANPGCFDAQVVLPVTVVDANNQPVTGATVTATNRGTGKSVTGTTDANGICNAVTEAIGAGDVDLKALDGARMSSAFSVQWTCGACDCIASPASATLHVQ